MGAKPPFFAIGACAKLDQLQKCVYFMRPMKQRHHATPCVSAIAVAGAGSLAFSAWATYFPARSLRHTALVRSRACDGASSLSRVCRFYALGLEPAAAAQETGAALRGEKFDSFSTPGLLSPHASRLEPEVKAGHTHAALRSVGQPLTKCVHSSLGTRLAVPVFRRLAANETFPHVNLLLLLRRQVLQSTAKILFFFNTWLAFAARKPEVKAGHTHAALWRGQPATHKTHPRLAGDAAERPAPQRK